jgi:hypothetical protein
VKPWVFCKAKKFFFSVRETNINFTERQTFSYCFVFHGNEKARIKTFSIAEAYSRQGKPLLLQGEL